MDDRDPFHTVRKSTAEATELDYERVALRSKRTQRLAQLHDVRRPSKSLKIVKSSFTCRLNHICSCSLPVEYLTSPGRRHTGRTPGISEFQEYQFPVYFYRGESIG